MFSADELAVRNDVNGLDNTHDLKKCKHPIALLVSVGAVENSMALVVLSRFKMRI